MRIVLRGFLTEDTTARYNDALRGAARTMADAGCPLDQMLVLVLVLVDARKLGTQSQLLIADQARFSAPDRQPRRIGTVTSGALVKLQVQRVAFPNQRIFTDRQDALAWLRS